MQTTIITCVEAGQLEQQVVMLAKSLRLNGGAMSALPVFAVKPRSGPSLKRRTLDSLKELNVEFLDERLNVDNAWWSNANKAATMSFMEKRVNTPFISWLDSDMIIAGDISNIIPHGDCDYIVRAGEGYLGTNGDDDNSQYWKRLCQLFELNLDEFPVIVAVPENRSIKAYWQTGVYSYRPSTGLGAMHEETISRLLRTPTASKIAGVYHQDQVSFALATQRLGLRHELLPWQMNFSINPIEKSIAEESSLENVRVLHYHGSISRENFDWFRNLLFTKRGDLIPLVDECGPALRTGLLNRFQRKYLRVVRDRKVKRFIAESEIF